MNKIRQTIKYFCSGLYYFFFSLVMTIPFELVRCGWLRVNLKRFGKGSFAMTGVEFLSPQRISIGNRCVINKKTLLDGRGGITIGNDVDIAREVLIWSCTHDISDINHSTFCKSVTIEDHVWIGARATILPGITIGRGAVIGTSSVVTKDIPPMAVAVGNPAKIIKYRVNELSYNLDFHPWFS